MARVLQIRRGTSAQNDNFTGLAGEITFDTDAKTLRVHDGHMLGGYTLARADQVTPGDGDASSGPAFDINSVPDDFWAEKFAQFAPPHTSFTVITSRAVAMSKTTAIEYIFNTELTPFYVNTVLVCAVADAGYAVGDEVSTFGIGQYSATPPNMYRDISGLHLRIPICNQDTWVRHRTSNAVVTATEGCWNIKFRLYC